MTSQRKLKKTATALGLTSSGLQLAQMMEEVLAELRWMQTLAYANQFLMNERLEVSEEERDRVFKAASRAVEENGQLQSWQHRLQRLRTEMERMQVELGGNPEQEAEAAGD